MEAAADEEDSGCEDVNGVELHTGHHGDQHQAGQLGQGQRAGHGGQVPGQGSPSDRYSYYDNR